MGSVAGNVRKHRRRCVGHSLGDESGFKFVAKIKSLCVEQVGSKKLSFHACSFPILIPYFKAPRIEAGGPTQSARAQFQ